MPEMPSSCAKIQISQLLKPSDVGNYSSLGSWATRAYRGAEALAKAAGVSKDDQLSFARYAYAQAKRAWGKCSK
eukprot:848853-Pyramimonas_sp.AAC.1